MFHALRSAAAASGIRLTYVPVLYERAGFARPEPEGAQRRFATDADGFLAHFERARAAAGGRVAIGIGAHSIRAVTPPSLDRIVASAEAADVPMHIHAAEQRREVEQSLEFYRRRPVRWLLERYNVNERWCLVHATHMDADEVGALAASGAVACLCPSTEANLGDGLFPLRPFLEAGGRIAIGSDSQVSINPYEELRWLEYGQRLAAESRNIAAVRDSHVGHELFGRAVDGGAQACGHALAGLAEGAHADLVCLYDGDPMLVGHTDASRIDALVFSGCSLPIERVMVDGEWCVIDGRHVTAGASSRGLRRAQSPDWFREACPTMSAGSKPRYQQLKDAIIERITDGELRPGDRVPSENELVLSAGVSRMTANRALRELTDEGYVERVAGRGTYVSDFRAQSHVREIQNIADEIAARGHRHSADVVSRERAPARGEVARALHVRTGTP